MLLSLDRAFVVWLAEKEKFPQFICEYSFFLRVTLKNSEAETFDVFQETHWKMNPNTPILLMFLQFCLTLTCFWSRYCCF